LPYDFVNELRDLWETGVLRPDAFIFLRKDQEGKVSAMEGGRLQEGDDVMEINVLVAALAGLELEGPGAVRAKAESAIEAAAEGDFGLAVKDIHKIAARLPNGHSAVVVFFENRWERKFKQIAGKYSGTVIAQKIVPSASFDELVKGPAKVGSS
jgi:hypothetical protein